MAVAWHAMCELAFTQPSYFTAASIKVLNVIKGTLKLTTPIKSRYI
jgi:hypothetical protein